MGPSRPHRRRRGAGSRCSLAGGPRPELAAVSHIGRPGPRRHARRRREHHHLRARQRRVRGRRRRLAGGPGHLRRRRAEHRVHPVVPRRAGDHPVLRHHDHPGVRPDAAHVQEHLRGRSCHADSRGPVPRRAARRLRRRPELWEPCDLDRHPGGTQSIPA